MNPIDIAYSTSHEDLQDRDRRLRRSHPKEDLRDLKKEALEFDSNLNSESYLHWVQSMNRIFDLKEYSDEKAFKLVVFKKKGHVLPWHDKLKKNKAREAKSKIKIYRSLRRTNAK